MVLHCASRLGILDYLYQQRHQVAFHAGLISEIPITVCARDFHQTQKLVQATDHSQLPSFLHALEIQLFFESNTPQIDGLHFVIVSPKFPQQQSLPTDFSESVFHPPLFL
jgi:hypothetical protein